MVCCWARAVCPRAVRKACQTASQWPAEGPAD
jgi:hypothetical protein